jgi:hypothetical protein
VSGPRPRSCTTWPTLAVRKKFLDACFDVGLSQTCYFQRFYLPRRSLFTRTRPRWSVKVFQWTVLSHHKTVPT